MLSVPGIYQDGQIILLEKIPLVKHAKVIITVLEEEQTVDAGQPDESPTAHWIGVLANTAQIIGDIVHPLTDAEADWEVLNK